jgi:hypothetical protein
VEEGGEVVTAGGGGDCVRIWDCERKGLDRGRGRTGSWWRSEWNVKSLNLGC